MNTYKVIQTSVVTKSNDVTFGLTRDVSTTTREQVFPDFKSASEFFFLCMQQVKDNVLPGYTMNLTVRLYEYRGSGNVEIDEFVYNGNREEVSPNGDSD